VSKPAPRGWRRLAGEGRTFLTAMIALVTAAIALLYQLVPALKPDPRERVGAAVEIFAVEPAVQLGQWLQDAFPEDVDAATERVLGTRTPEPNELTLTLTGTVVYVRTEVDGYKHRAIAIRVRLYVARSQRRAPTPFAAPYRETSGARIDSPNRRSVQLLFLPDLRAEPTPEFLRVELIDAQSGSMLAVADSPELVRGRIRR